MVFKLILILSLLLTISCAAITISPEAMKVKIVSQKPSEVKCKYLGEVIGSQGNFFTGDFTSNEALMKGARNDMRNKGYKLGGNIVHLQSMNNSSGWDSTGTTSTVLVGQVYNCSN